MTTVEDLADDLAGDPGDVRVILQQHDVYADDLSESNAREVRKVLDPGGERSRHLLPPDPYGLGSRRSPTDPAE